MKQLKEEINTHGLIVDFGRHKGERWTRIPVGYLKWLVNDVGDEKGKIAQAELNRRGTTMPTELVLSGHAIDRASQITKEWQETGVNSWLSKIANEALEVADGKERIKHKGYKFCFTYGNHFPTLKTIMR